MIEKHGELLSYLTSQQSAQQYLQHCYERLGEPNFKSKSYENYSAFLYYLDHGKQFYEIGNSVNILAQPVLYFYGLSHLLKACLLTKRPNYPESTQDLSHGVTTRKKKKRDYSFLEDEVKVQQRGLFPYFSNYLFTINPIPFEKIQMKDLLSLIPELLSFFSFQGDKQMVEIGLVNSLTLKFPTIILDNYHLTLDSFVRRIENYLPSIIQVDENLEGISIQLTDKINVTKGPFFIHMENEKIYFPNQRSLFLPISEIMIHYLILYNLSMLSRYEAEWWGDLLSAKSDIDYVFIKQFLYITAKKMPIMIENLLYHNGLQGEFPN